MKPPEQTRKQAWIFLLGQVRRCVIGHAFGEDGRLLVISFDEKLHGIRNWVVSPDQLFQTRTQAEKDAIMKTLSRRRSSLDFGYPAR